MIAGLRLYWIERTAFRGAGTQSVTPSTVEALAKIKHPRSAQLLAKCVTEGNESIRKAAADAMARSKDGFAIPELVGLLAHQTLSVRRVTASALSKAGWKPLDAEQAGLFAVASGNLTQAVALKSAAVKALLIVLKELSAPSSNRKEAAKALGEIGDPSAAEPIAAALIQADKEVAWELANTLGELRNARVVPLVLKAFSNVAEFVNEDRREGMAYVLGELGGEESIVPLAESLDRVQWTYFLFVVCRALEKLFVRLGTKNIDSRIRTVAGKKLIDRLTHFDSVATAAACALKALGVQPRDPHLRLLMAFGTGDESFVLAAGPLAIEPLLSWREGSNGEMTTEAKKMLVRVIGRLTDQQFSCSVSSNYRVRSVIAKMASYDDSSEGKCAAQCLKRLG